MKIIPMDIVRKNFSRKMMGFSPEEVMEFLSLIATEMENIIRERNNLRDSLREKEMSVVEFRQREEVLKNTISTANMMSEKMKQDAEREARLIVNDANQQADIITRDARDSLKKIYSDVSELKRIRLQYENNLRALVESHLTMMEQGQKIMPDPELEGLEFQGDTNSTNPQPPIVSSDDNAPSPSMPQPAAPQADRPLDSPHPTSPHEVSQHEAELSQLQVNVSQAIKEKMKHLEL